MTPAHNIITAQDAHVQAAFQAACAFGRRQYDERMRWRDYDCSKAIRALNEMHNAHAPVVKERLTTESLVIGGGNSLTGKICWLIENHGAMTREELAHRTGADLLSVFSIVAFLKNKRVLQSTGRGASATFVLKAVSA